MLFCLGNRGANLLPISRKKKKKKKGRQREAESESKRISYSGIYEEANLSGHTHMSSQAKRALVKGVRPSAPH